MLLLAAAAVLAGVILVATGQGGEMAGFPADQPPFTLERVAAPDIALLQPPRSLWGYNPQVTDEALQVIAQAVSERDIEIERLRGQLTDLQQAPPDGPAGQLPAAQPATGPAGPPEQPPAEQPPAEQWQTAPAAPGQQGTRD